MQSLRAIPSFYCPSFATKRIPVLSLFEVVELLFEVLIEHRVCIISVVERHKSCWNHIPYIVRVQKDIRATLLINRTGILIVSGNALGVFTGSGNVVQFSVDLSDFCRCFREEGITTIKIYISHHLLCVNEVYNVIKRNNLFDVRSTI